MNVSSAEPGRPVVLLASSRSDGNTLALATLALPVTAATTLDLGEFNIGYYSYTDLNSSDDFFPLVERLIASPVWVLATRFTGTR